MLILAVCRTRQCHISCEPKFWATILAKTFENPPSPPNNVKCEDFQYLLQILYRFVDFQAVCALRRKACSKTQKRLIRMKTLVECTSNYGEYFNDKTLWSCYYHRTNRWMFNQFIKKIRKDRTTSSFHGKKALFVCQWSLASSRKDFNIV